MNEQQHVTQYKGINNDLNLDVLPPEFYIDANDIRVTSTEGESGYAITNLMGNKLSFTLPNINERIIGCCNVRDSLVIATLDTTNGHGRFYEITYDFESKSTTLNFIYGNPDFDFSVDAPIKMIGRHETNNIRRIYWTDYTKQVKTLKLNEDYSAISDPNYFNIFNTPELFRNLIVTNISTTGGSLEVGMYQYAYKLITKDGRETLISPETRYIPISADNHKTGTSNNYGGSPVDTISTKSVTVELSNIDTNKYEQIELYSVYRKNINDIPVVSFVERQILTGTSVIITHTGQEEGSFEIELDEYTLTSFPFYTSKELAVKDDILSAHNIKQKTFEVTDEEFGAKCFRYRNDGVNITPNSDPYVNPYNNLTSSEDDYDPVNQYKYQADGNTLGGQSVDDPISGDPYVKYRFVTKELQGIDYFSTNYTGQVPDSQENLGQGYLHPNSSFGNHASPYLAELYRGYKRGEVYRFGIVFYDKENNPSFVKYIGDIKFPEIYDIDSSTNESGELYFPVAKAKAAASSTTSAYVYALGIQFEINIPQALSDKISGWKIVRVKRENKDKTRLSQGVINKYFELGGGTDGTSYHLTNHGYVASRDLVDVDRFCLGSIPGFHSNRAIDNTGTIVSPVSWMNNAPQQNYISFFSPEVSFKKDVPEYRLGDGLRLSGIYELPNTGTLPNAFLAKSTTPKMGITRTMFKNTLSPLSVGGGISINANRQTTISSLQEVGPSFTTTVLNGQEFKNYAVRLDDADTDTDDIKYASFNGTNLIMILSDAVPFGADASSPSVLLPGNVNNEDFFYYHMVDYVRFLSEQYGGTGEAAVANNQFISCSEYIPITSPGVYSANVYGGDTYVAYWELLKTMNDVDRDSRSYTNDDTDPSPSTPVNNPTSIAGSVQEGMFIPVETTVNLEYEHGYNISNTSTFEYSSGNFDPATIQEEGNVLNANDTETRGFYEYNEVYSQENELRKFITKPIGTESEEIYDVRAYYSDVKTNGELVDSWTKFRVNNLYDVSSDFGAINAVANLNDELFFLQDKGFGRYIINPRAVVSSSEGPTELGTGTAFQDHDYFSTTNGCIHQFGVQVTRDSIIWIDAINQKMMRFSPSQGTQPISDVIGVKSLLADLLQGEVLKRRTELGDSPFTYKGITSTYDRINNEVWFTIFGTQSKSKSSLKPNTFYEVGDLIFSAGIWYICIQSFTTTDVLQLPSSDVTHWNPLITKEEEPIINPKQLSRTIVYNELHQAVVCPRRTEKPTIYLNAGDLILSPNPNSEAAVYAHGLGNAGVFYSSNPEDMWIEFVVNSNHDFNKVLSFIEYNSTVRDTNDNIIQDESLSKIRVYNDYQDSGVVDLDDNRLIRRFRKWRIKVPRDSKSKNGRARFRGTFFKVRLYFSNENNRKLVLNRIISHYNIQIY